MNCHFRLCLSSFPKTVPLVSSCSMCLHKGDVVSSTNLWWCTSSILDTSILLYGGRRGRCWPRQWLIRYGMVACFHHMASHGQSTAWWSPSLSRTKAWPLSLLWNSSAHLALFFLLWKYLPSDVVLTPAILPIPGRLVEGRSILFLPIQVQAHLPVCGVKHDLLVCDVKHDLPVCGIKPDLPV